MEEFIPGPSSPFESPSFLYRIIFSPIKTLIQCLYFVILTLRGPPLYHSAPSLIRIVCISDTHAHRAVHIPMGDVLVHAGDLTNHGTLSELQEHVDWISSLPHLYKIAIAGNHDSFLDPRSRHEEDIGKSIRWDTVQYLQHSSAVLAFPRQGNRRLTFYGAPQIPQCGGAEFAFQYERRTDAWSGTIPSETDVLITHTPPRHHLDLPAGLGCEFLLKELWKVRPRVHIFGHVHAGYGREHVFWDKCQEVFERLCAREVSMPLLDLLSVYTWADIALMSWLGLRGILWRRVWGGDEYGGVMINASLTYRNTEKLENSAQVIDV